MHWKFTKTWLVVSGLLVHTACFASRSNPNVTQNTPTLLSPTEETTKKLEHRVSVLEQRRGGLLNPPARPIVEDYDFNAYGDLLVWAAHENGLPIAIKNRATNFANQQGFANLQDSSVQHLEFDWNAGFRIGMDFDMPYDGWDVNLTFLSLRSTADMSESAEGNRELFATRLNTQIPAFITDGAPPNPFLFYSESEARWKGYLNQIDLDLGREFFVSKWLTLRPHVGVRTTWLRQRLHTNYEDGIAVTGAPVAPDAEVSEKCKWWGIGLEGGLGTQWTIGGGVSLYGDISAAIESGFQKVRTKEEVEGFANDFENSRDSTRIARPILDLQLGVRWDRNFQDNSFNFGMHFGWEEHIYFSQNQFHTNANLAQFTANQGDLSYHGFTLGMHLNF